MIGDDLTIQKLSEFIMPIEDKLYISNWSVGYLDTDKLKEENAKIEDNTNFDSVSFSNDDENRLEDYINQIRKELNLSSNNLTYKFNTNKIEYDLKSHRINIMLKTLKSLYSDFNNINITDYVKEFFWDCPPEKNGHFCIDFHNYIVWENIIKSLDLEVLRLFSYGWLRIFDNEYFDKIISNLSDDNIYTNKFSASTSHRYGYGKESYVIINESFINEIMEESNKKYSLDSDFVKVMNCLLSSFAGYSILYLINSVEKYNEVDRSLQTKMENVWFHSIINESEDIKTFLLSLFNNSLLDLSLKSFIGNYDDYIKKSSYIKVLLSFRFFYEIMGYKYITYSINNTYNKIFFSHHLKEWSLLFSKKSFSKLKKVYKKILSDSKN